LSGLAGAATESPPRRHSQSAPRCLAFESIQFGKFVGVGFTAAGLAAQFGEALPDALHVGGALVGLGGLLLGLGGLLLGVGGLLLGVGGSSLGLGAEGVEFDDVEEAAAIWVIDDHLVAGQVETGLQARADETVCRPDRAENGALAEEDAQSVGLVG